MVDFQNKQVVFSKLGTIPYAEALDIQVKAFDSIVNSKIANRQLELNQKKPTCNHLFFCEHPHVYTLGRSGSMEHLLISEEGLKNRNAEFYKTGRGGDITYHGPGQLVAYPVLDLDNFFTDIHKYMRLLEEAVILTLKYFGISSGRISGLTGVWIDIDDPEKAKKICAFGVKTSRWVTMHGLSLNVNTDLSYFDYIVPCGISDKAVTSMQQELNRKVSMDEVMEQLLFQLSSLFGMNIVKEIKQPVVE